METKAILRGARMSAQKGRLVADLIRGKPVDQAMSILAYTPKKGAGIMKKLLESAIANAEHNLESIGKAGRVRWRGVRPTVRGVAMNPIDHPHGGGEGRTAAAQPPVSPWGVQSKGFKTRRNKRTQVMIVRDRRVK